MDPTSIKIIHLKIGAVIFKQSLAWTLFVLSFCCYSEVFTWKDELGVTHFSYEPPGEKISKYSALSQELTYVHIVGEKQADKILNVGSDNDNGAKNTKKKEADSLKKSN